MGQQDSGAIRVSAVALEAIRRARGSAGAVATQQAVRRRWRAVDFLAMPLVAGVVAATLWSDPRQIAGMPFLLAIPVWMITRARGALAGLALTAMLLVTAWVGWHDAPLVVRINVSLVIVLGLLAGLDGHRRRASQALVVTARAREQQRRSTLTRREHDVLRLLGSGHTNKEVAAQLGLSVRTIESHRSRIVTKLASSGRADLYRHAQELGLLEPGAINGN